MRYKKLVLIILSLMIVLALFGCKKKNASIGGDGSSLNQDHSMDPFNSSDVNIDTFVYEDKEGEIVYDIVKVDQVILPDRYKEENEKLASAIDIYNAERDADGKNFLEIQKSEIRSMKSERNDDTLVLSYEDVVTVNRIDDQVFSFMESISTYTGGAHGSYAPIGRNYIVGSGEELTSFDVFTDEKKLKEVLIENISSAYADTELFPEWKETIDTHFDEKKSLNILVGADFVDVMFEPYYLGPWSTGTISVSLLYKEHSDILNKKYFR